ncbi:MAG: cyclic nucleotide-binding domain-containing protein [Gammaproteobacteria bacterium]|nr:MAG: cyclic nucleotide-binding domain-containing protein [Gammaproteobacteria bacterium]
MQPQKNITPVRVEFDLSLTRTLIPLKDMSEAHLLELLSDANSEVICAGQTLFSRGSYDAQHVYLLHGNVSLVDENNVTTIIKGRSTLLPIGHHQPRLVTAVAESDCSVLRLDSERLDKLLAWSQVADYLQLNISRQRDFDEDIDWMMTVLKSNLFFKVPPINVEEIFSRLIPQVVYAGDVVIRQGEIGDQCYFLKEGEAEVWRHNDSNRQLLATVGIGRCFGEDALVNETARNASVIMLTDGVLMRLDKQDFFRLLKEPVVASISLESFAGKIADGAVAVDVRSEEEYAELHLHSAVNVPLNLLGIKSRMLDKSRAYIFYCNTGRRSRAAAHLLTQQGFKAFALDDCSSLFTQSRWSDLLDNRFNYVLRDGVAHQGL